MQADHTHMWRCCLAVIKEMVTEAAFNTWFMPIVPLKYEDHKFTIQVPSQFFYEYLEDKYVDILRMTLHRVMGPGTILNYRILVDNSAKLTVDYPTQETTPAPTSTANTAAKPIKEAPVNQQNPFVRRPVPELDPQLNPKYNFHNYFEGFSNKLARTAGEAVSQNPGKTSFNPLFIFGPSGVGKTHLCHAIGTRIKEINPEKRVLYVSAHLFRVQFTDAARKNTTNDFINFYQNIDVLLMDDIQELIGMDKTQNTFFHIFNHLHQLGKQLVLTSDKPPIDLQGMEERLITRLKWGLTAELQRPDYELRKKILNNKISHDGLIINDDVSEFIAENVTENVRDLEGVLVSLMANSLIHNKEIDLSLTKRVVSQAVRLEKKQINIDLIQKVVCEYFQIDTSVLQTASRKREIVQARQITMYLAKKLTDLSFSHIGKVIGKKNHATVLHACKTVKDQIETNKTFKATVEKIEGMLKA